MKFQILKWDIKSYVTKINVMMNLKDIGNSSVSLSSTSNKIKKVDHYIKINDHKLIALRF